MILQNILFPSLDTCDRHDMYFRTNGLPIIEAEKQQIQFSKGDSITTNTYFNSFSINKWLKYTKINDINISLRFSGEFLLILHGLSITNNNLSDIILLEKRIKANKINSCTVNFNNYVGQYILYFELVALGDSYFYGGQYETKKEFELNEVKIAANICTYKREADVYHNCEMFKKYIINNKKSPLYGKLDVYISDNSQTLDNNKINNEHIFIFKNKNLGGSGGFTRGLIEILKADKGYSHVLMLDDDIAINPESIVKTYVFLTCLKDEYLNAFIGGQMLNKDRRNIQSEAADHFNIVKHHPVKPNYNLEDPVFIVKNEIEDTINYFSWWYCCMPMDIISNNNLPIPVFIKRDDIEYGLRNGTTFITLNGICVWHEAFQFKSSAHLDYYYIRNLCIMNSKHRKNFTKKQLIKELTKLVLKNNVLRYRYKNAELLLMGVQDYLKGIEWLKDLEGEGFNESLMKLNYVKKPIDKIRWTFQYGDYTRNLGFKESKAKKILRLLTLNGWLLKKKRNVVVPSYEPAIGLFNRANKVLNYEDSTKSAYITSKSYKNLFIILGMYFKTVMDIIFKFDKVNEEYRSRFNELTNINFWNDYLNRDKKQYDIKSKLIDDNTPKNTKRQVLTYFVSLFLIALQWILFFIPIKKNRIMLCVYNRKGYTCNPKYILKELRKQYGDKYEIYWITSFPESCINNNEYNVKVIKTDSFSCFIKYLRTKVFITNDRFPTWAAHKPNQKWINVWHGAINYKHIGYDYIAPRSDFSWKLFYLANRQPNYYLSASRFFTVDTAKSFKLDEDIFVEYGFPRNDLYFYDNDELKKKIRNALNIKDNEKVVLFAPTFRIGMNNSFYGMDFGMLKESLREKFGGKWVILFRDHNFVKTKNTNSDIINVSNYEDMNELLLIVDVLISDYSSCMYDYILQRKPCFVYASDIDNYQKNDRSFAYPLQKWPYTIARNNEELRENILNFKKANYIKKVDEHLNDSGSFDDGHASKKMVKLIDSISGNYN